MTLEIGAPYKKHKKWPYAGQ